MLNIPASGNYESTTPHPGRGYTLLWVWCAAVNAFRMPTGSLNVQLDLPIGPRLLVQLFGGQKVGVVLQGVNQRSPWNFSWIPVLSPMHSLECRDHRSEPVVTMVELAPEHRLGRRIQAAVVTYLVEVDVLEVVDHTRLGQSICPVLQLSVAGKEKFLVAHLEKKNDARVVEHGVHAAHDFEQLPRPKISKSRDQPSRIGRRFLERKGRSPRKQRRFVLESHCGPRLRKPVLVRSARRVSPNRVRLLERRRSEHGYLHAWQNRLES